MTNIVSIDTTSQAWQRDNNRQPAKDFAHELAKHDAQVRSDGQQKIVTQNSSGATSKGTPDEQQVLESPKTESLPIPKAPAEAVPDAAVHILGTTEEQQLAQAIVAPTGVTEALLGARIFGWHALAQIYLSELTVADEGQVQGQEAVSNSLLTSSQSVLSAENVEPAPEGIAPTSSTIETVSAMPQVDVSTQTQPRSTLDDAASANVAEISTADASAASYWPERSLRVTRQRDGTSVVWLRDFRISDAEASHLIQFVLNDAKTKGFVLSKIMLNGREAWASSNGT